MMYKIQVIEKQLFQDALLSRLNYIALHVRPTKPRFALPVVFVPQQDSTLWISIFMARGTLHSHLSHRKLKLSKRISSFLSFLAWKKVTSNNKKVGCMENQGTFPLQFGILLLHRCTLKSFIYISKNLIHNLHACDRQSS